MTSLQSLAKSIVLPVLILLVPVVGYAQSSKVVTAYNYLKDNDYLKAKEHIDAAAQHKKTSTWSKTWYYRGMIYQGIYSSQEETYASLNKWDALREAFISLKKARELNSKRINKDDVERRYKMLANFFL